MVKLTKKDLRKQVEESSSEGDYTYDLEDDDEDDNSEEAP
jgi:hypothetical protein